MADDDKEVHRLAGSSGQERGGLIIMKKKKPSDEGGSMAPPKKSMLGEPHIHVDAAKLSLIVGMF